MNNKTGARQPTYRKKKSSQNFIEGRRVQGHLDSPQNVFRCSFLATWVISFGGRSLVCQNRPIIFSSFLGYFPRGTKCWLRLHTSHDPDHRSCGEKTAFTVWERALGVKFVITEDTSGALPRRAPSALPPCSHSQPSGPHGCQVRHLPHKFWVNWLTQGEQDAWAAYPTWSP